MADDQGDARIPQSVLEVTAFVPDARRDPHTPLRLLREHRPVMRDEMLKTWLLTRYGDVKDMVNDRSFDRHPEKAEEGSITRRLVREDGESRTSILFLDDPDHARIRQPLARVLYARIQSLKGDIETIVDETISAAPASGRFDLMAEIAIPIPVLVIARILGVDEARIDDFREWTEGVILGLNPARTDDETARMERGIERLEAYFTDLMEERRARPREDLISDMVTMQASGEAEITDRELRINLEALLVGGNLTTSDLIGNGVWLLLTHPRQMAALRADPSLSSALVEEVLRFEAPVSATSRIVPDERVVGGCPMSKGQAIFSSLASANRDPAVFERPDDFDITVKRASHVAFGGGAHMCIGAPLARIEARRVFQKLFERYTSMRLPDQEIAWRALPFFRGLERLDVEV